ncbi:hypothetical protein ABZ379_16255 [Streptomyces canus]|uniref:hypothetical protein n=1 Tax=Streptomyces canus TaxID=58343 RepID=UPI00340029E0
MTAHEGGHQALVYLEFVACPSQGAAGPAHQRTGDAAAAARLDEGDVDLAVAGIPARLPNGLVGRPVAVTERVLGTSRTGRTWTWTSRSSSPHGRLVCEAADRCADRWSLVTGHCTVALDGVAGILTRLARPT